MFGSFNGPVVQSIPLFRGIFSTASFWNNTLYVNATSSAMFAYTLNTSTVQFSQASSTSHSYGFPGTTTSISAAGTASGIVWSMDSGAFCKTSAKCGPAILFAHDATNLATELWNSSTVAGNAAGNAVKFTLPTVANGHVYIGTRGNNTAAVAGTSTIQGELEIYGLLP
jgi:outer membrane protein assembly factor BamB